MNSFSVREPFLKSAPFDDAAHFAAISSNFFPQVEYFRSQISSWIIHEIVLSVRSLGSFSFLKPNLL